MASSVVAMKVSLNAQQYVNEMQAIEKSLNRMSFAQQQAAIENETDLKKQAALRKRFARENEQALNRRLRTENKALKITERDNRLLRQKEGLIKRNAAAYEKYAGFIAGASASILGLGYGIKRLTDISSRYAEQDAKLVSAVRATGQQLSFNIGSVREYAMQLSELSGITRDQVTSGTAMLTSFNLNEESVKKLMPLMVDMSAFLGQDMKSSALLMGKAMTTGLAALSRAGVTLTDVQKAAFDAADGTEKAAQLAKILGQNFGGAAANINAADQGMANFKVAVEEASVAIGDAIKDDVAFALQRVTHWITEATKGWKGFADLIGISATGKTREELEQVQNDIQGITQALKILRNENRITGESLGKIGDVFGRTLSSIDVQTNRQRYINELLIRRKSLMQDMNKLNQSGQVFEASDITKPKPQLKEAVQTKTSKINIAAKEDEFAEYNRINQAELDASKEQQDKITRGLLENLRKRGLITREAFKKSLDDVAWKERESALIEEGYSKSAAQLVVQSEKDKLAAETKRLEEAAKAKQKAREEERKQVEKDAEQTRLIRLEEKRFSEQLAKEERQAKEREEEKWANYRESQAQRSAGIAIGIAQTLANDIATGQENAAERALAAALTQYGGQLVGLGTKASYEGATRLVSSYGADPSGYGLLALGGAAIAAGVGMGAAGAAVNTSITGGAATSARGEPAQIGGVESQANEVGGRREGSEQTIIINAGGSVYGDMRGVVNDFAKASAKANRFNLGEL